MAFFLAYTLTFYLTCSLASILTYFLAYILTLFLAFYPASSLTSFQAFILAFFKSFSSIYPDVLSIWHLFWHFFWHSIWHSLWRLAEFQQWSSQLRSGNAHWDLALAVEGGARGTRRRRVGPSPGRWGIVYTWWVSTAMLVYRREPWERLILEESSLPASYLAGSMRILGDCTIQLTVPPWESPIPMSERTLC